MLAGILTYLLRIPRKIAENLREPMIAFYSTFVPREKLAESYDVRAFEVGMPIALIMFGVGWILLSVW